MELVTVSYAPVFPLQLEQDASVSCSDLFLFGAIWCAYNQMQVLYNVFTASKQHNATKLNLIVFIQLAFLS